METQQPQPPAGQDPSGWHRDPWGRFEYRYFNGVQWTSDVAINGQRYVDSPIQQLMPQLKSPRPSRGMAITSFVAGIAGVVIGWVPFVFVLGACAAIAAIVFGILGLNAARRHDGHGRGFAVAGLALSPFALAVCLGGFYFTRAVVREFRDFVEPGPHELFVEQPCTFEGGRVTLRGTIRNLDDHEHDYRIFVDFSSALDVTKSSMVPVRDVGPSDTASWSSSADIAGNSIKCEVTGVFGPLPFDVDTQS